MYVVYIWIDVVVLKLMFSVGQKSKRGDGGNQVLVAVEAVPAGSKPPAAVGVRISTGERNDVSALVSLSTRAYRLKF